MILIIVLVKALKTEGVRCSVIGLAAEVHVCRQLANQTKGLYNVILDDCHFQDLLLQQVDPPPAAVTLESNLIKMGFPHQMSVEGSEEPLTMCMCHVDSVDEGSKLNTGGYYCPQCYSKYCELPVECRACGLTLVSAPHLARSYHHLFPAANYDEVVSDNQVAICFACQKNLGNSDKQVSLGFQRKSVIWALKLHYVSLLCDYSIFKHDFHYFLHNFF